MSSDAPEGWGERLEVMLGRVERPDPTYQVSIPRPLHDERQHFTRIEVVMTNFTSTEEAEPTIRRNLGRFCSGAEEFTMQLLDSSVVPEIIERVRTRLAESDYTAMPFSTADHAIVLSFQSYKDD